MSSALFGLVIDFVLAGTGRVLMIVCGWWRAGPRRAVARRAASGASSPGKRGRFLVASSGPWLVGFAFWFAVAVAIAMFLRAP